MLYDSTFHEFSKGKLGNNINATVYRIIAEILYNFHAHYLP